MVSKRDSFFETDFEFRTEDGLQIAFGITSYDDNYDTTEDPDYGDLKAYYKTWGYEDAPGEVFTEIESNQCTNEQLGIDENGA